MTDDRSIEPDTADDEITTDVDPEWIASIRAGTTAEPGPGDGTDAVGEADDWARAEPAWDPEATIGASSGLIERIRREIGSPAAAAAPAVPAAPVGPVAPPRPPTPAVPAPTVPSPTVQAAPTGERADVSTTVRWEPRQRLTTAAPVAETAVIAPTTHSGLDHTKLAIAIVAAVTLIVIAWLVMGSRGGGTESPPVDSVPTSGVESSVPNGESTG